MNEGVSLNGESMVINMVDNDAADDFLSFNKFLAKIAADEKRFIETNLKVNYLGRVSTPLRFDLKKSGILIEGDSLLLHFLDVDFREDDGRLIDCTYGPSSLHLCYLVNRYLETFTAHDIRVTVVFFQNHKYHYKNKLYQLLREVVIKNIESVEPSLMVNVKQFSSFLSGHFAVFMSSLMKVLTPLELMLFKPELVINTWYGSILLKYWGVAIGDIAHCNLLGLSEIRDRDRDINVLSVNIENNNSDERCDGYDEDDCIKIEIMTSPKATPLRHIIKNLTLNDSNSDDSSSESDTDESIDEEEPLETSQSQLHALLCSDDVSRVDCKALIVLLSRLVDKNPSFEPFVKAHIHAVHTLSTTHPEHREQYYLPDVVPKLCGEQLAVFEEYCEAVTEVIFVNFKQQEDCGLVGDSVKVSGKTLFVGDIWDGRLLVAAYLVCNPEERSKCEFITRPRLIFSPPFAITGTLVDNVNRVTKERFADVANLHNNMGNVAFSESSAAQRGVGGNMAVDVHTHNLSALTAHTARPYNAKNFYRQCGFDFFDRKVEDNITPSAPFKRMIGMGARESFHNSSASGRYVKSQANMTDGDGYGDPESLIEQLKVQEIIDSTVQTDLERSGIVQLEAVAKGKLFTPFGPPRDGWQDLSLTTTMYIRTIEPRYNAVTSCPDMEKALSERYMVEYGFRPEPWQLSMLHSIEANRSVLIMAPTSSGKTLAAKYAMRKVCRDNLERSGSQKGKGVFVQPTNALVNQTFGAFLIDPYVGKERVAMFTAEVRSPNFESGNYEVLITNPQCLQILLTSGHSSDSNCFYERLSIGQDDGSYGANGTVWEQLLATVDCPVIGLSATLGNAEPFYQWLCSTKEQQLQHKRVSGQAVIESDGIVDRLEHHERSTPLHYFNKLLSQWYVKQDSLDSIDTPFDTISSACDESSDTLSKISQHVRDVGINPLQFLPSFDHNNDAQLSSFFESVPHLKLADIRAVFTSAQNSSILSRFSDVYRFSTHTVLEHGGSYADVAAVYNELRTLIAKQLLLPGVHDVDGLQQYAQFRLTFSRLIAQMHTAVLKIPSLFDRMFVDALCAHALHQAGIDWYGQQWLDGIKALDTLDNNESLLRETLLKSNGSMILYSLNKVSACLFANDPKGAEETVDSFCVYPSSITAVNRGVYYFLQLLLKRDQQEAISLPGSCMDSVATKSGCAGDCNDQSAETTTIISAAVIHKELINIQRPSSVLPDECRNRFSTHDVRVLLHDMLEDSEENTTTSPTSTAPNEVQQPTLIFHLDRKKLDRFIEDLVDEDCLGDWFGSSKHQGCFLTPEEIAEVKALPNTSESRKQGLLYGIGLHNAVVKEGRQYRSLVEKLFQNKKLLFVFATTSLSYGINMPCSKVVFLGDSQHLSNMVFRQSSGRAGRRGHMSGAGNIYFVGFTPLSIMRKLCTPIDGLSPRQAVSPAYILKLTSVSATCHANNHNWVDHMALQGLMNPLFEHLLMDKAAIRKQFRAALLNSIHFSWSFLAEKGYINSAGVAQVKASFPYRMHFLEPRCFLVAELLDSFLNPESEGNTGLLALVDDTPCEDPSEAQKRQEKLDLDVFMMMVYMASFSFVDKGHPLISSYVLPDCIRTAWSQYNAEVARSLVGFMRFHCESFSEELFPLNPNAFSVLSAATTAATAAAAARVTTTDEQGATTVAHQSALARSCFTTPSGLGDKFRQIKEMLMSVKRGMIVDSRSIPTTDIRDFVSGLLLTTYQEGVIDRRDKDSEKSCETFSRDMRAVVTALERMYSSLTEAPKIGSKPYILMKSFERVRGKFVSQLKRAKKVQFCNIKKGIVTAVNRDRFSIHFYDDNCDGEDKLRRFDVSSNQFSEPMATLKVLDCVQFCQPKDPLKSTQVHVSYVEQLKDENGSKITATRHQFRVVKYARQKDGTMDCEFEPVVVNDAVKQTSNNGDDGDNDDNNEPSSLITTYSLNLMRNSIVEVVYSPVVCGKGVGFAVRSRLIGIAAIFKPNARQVDSIYYLNKDMKLCYVTVMSSNNRMSYNLREGQIVEFTKDNFGAKDIQVCDGLKPAELLVMTLSRGKDNHTWEVNSPNFPSNFVYAGLRDLEPNKDYKFLFSSYISLDENVSFLITEMMPPPQNYGGRYSLGRSDLSSDWRSKK